MTILVTGGAGFIGSNFCNKLAKQEKVIVIDKLSYAGNIQNINTESKNISFYKKDILDKNFLSGIADIEKIDVLINFAAETHVDNSILNPGLFLETNILGVANILENCMKYEIENFIQISTDEVYGSIENGLANEESKINPSSPYSASKAAADLIIQSYFKTFGVRSKIIRLSNNYGPAQFDEKLIPYLIKSLAKGTKIGIYGDGLNIREWIFVDDAVDGIIEVMKSGNNGEFYNISSGVFRNNLEVLETISSTLGIKNPNFEFVEDRKGHDFRYAISSKKMHHQFDWKAKVDFNDGIEKTVDWYKRKRSWWSN
jgi:dTDP-glucose 4,6-dehydratase